MPATRYAAICASFQITAIVIRTGGNNKIAFATHAARARCSEVPDQRVQPAEQQRALQSIINSGPEMIRSSTLHSADINGGLPSENVIDRASSS